MLFTPFFSTLIFLALSALAAPAPEPELLHPIQRAEPQNPGSYIVKLKKDVSQQRAIAELQEKVVSISGNNTASVESVESQITHKWSKDILNGFAGKFNADTLQAIRTLPDVEYIVEDSIVSLSKTVTQTNAPWGLQRISRAGRISSDPNLLTYKYTYDDKGGSGVDVYVLDTGIRTTHTQLGGRATFGAAFPGNDVTDDNGHGTHCACTIAASRYGVAKKTNVIAVKVLPDSGSGPTSNVISGIDWVLQADRRSPRWSVVSMSLGTSANQAMDDAVTALVNQRIHVVVAAGNENTDAATKSPARAPSVITVGATDIFDSRAFYSNYGSVVDIFAPGTNVISCGIASDIATATMSGTSMATPHVAGLVAYLISRHGPRSPADMRAYIQRLGKDNVLTNIPLGTRNDLARNDVAII